MLSNMNHDFSLGASTNLSQFSIQAFYSKYVLKC